MVAPTSRGGAGVGAAAGRRNHPWQTEERTKRNTSHDNDDNDDDSSLGNGAIMRRFQQNDNRTVEQAAHDGRRPKKRNQSSRDDQHGGDYEVDYKSNPTQLFQRISHRLWDMAESRLDSHPDEARVWIVARYESEVGGGFNADDDDDDQIEGYQASLGGIKWRNLCLHLALLHSPHPAPLKLIQALIEAYPAACRRRNAEGSLPLHLACDNYSLVNNGADGEAVLFALVESYPDALVEVDGEGRTPVDLLERVGKGRSSSTSGGAGGGGGGRRGNKNGESIMYFMRRQMMLQQEQAKRTRAPGVEDTHDGGIGQIDRSAAAIFEAASTDVDGDDQREERSVTAAAREVVSRRKGRQKSMTNSRSRSLEPEPRRRNVDNSFGKGISDGSRSVDPSLARQGHHDDDEASLYYNNGDVDSSYDLKPLFENAGRHRRIQGQESQKQSKTTGSKKPSQDDAREDNDEYHRVKSGRRKSRSSLPKATLSSRFEDSLISVSSDSDYSKLIFNPDDDTSGDGGVKADLEEKLARALRENMSLRRDAEYGAANNSRENEQLRKAMKEITDLRGAIEDLTRNGGDRRHQRMAAAQLDSMRRNFDKLEEEMRIGQDRSKHQTDHIEELEAALAKATAKNSSLLESVDDLRQTNALLHERIDTSKDIIDDMRSREAGLRDKMDRREEELESIRSKYLQAQAVIDDLNAKHSKDQKEIDNCQREAQCLKETDEQKIEAQAKMIAALKEKVTTLKGIVKKNSTTYKKRFDDLKSKAMKVSQEKKALEEELISAQDASQDREQRIAELVSSRTSLREECDELGDRWVKSKKLVAEYEQQIKSLKSHAEKAQSECLSMEKLTKELQVSSDRDKAKARELSTELTASRAQIEGLQDTIKTLEAALQTKTDAGFDTREATQAMQKRIQDAEAQTGKVEADNAVIRKQLTESKFKVQQLEESITLLNSDKDSLESKLGATTEEKASLEKSLSNLEDENTVLKMKLIRANEDGVKYIEEIKQLGITIQEQSGTIRQLETDIGSLNVANDGLHSDKERLGEELADAKATVESLTAMRAQLEREKATRDETILSLERQISASTTELQLQTSVISDLQGKLIIKSQDFKALTEECCNLEQEVLAGRQLKLENDSLKKAVNSMQDVASDYRVKIQEMSSQLVTNGNESRAKINALKIANKEIQKDVDRLETELDQFKGAKSGIEQALSELHTENSELQAKLSSALAESNLSKAEIERLHHSIAKLQDSIQKVERQRDTAQLDRDGMHLKATTVESKLVALQSEAEKERQYLQADIVSMVEEINGYQALVQDLENAQLVAEKDKLSAEENILRLECRVQYLESQINQMETEAPSDVAVRTNTDGQDSVILDLLQRASDVVDYEPLKGLDLAISRTHREMREATSSGQLVTMTTESVTQISVLRNQNQDKRHRQLEESDRSIGGTSALLPDDKVHRELDDLYEENTKLIEEKAALAKSLERIKHSLYARETRALDAEREQEAKELEIDRLLDANHCLQSKSDALSRINEGHKASIADLQEEVEALRRQIESNNPGVMQKIDHAGGDSELVLLQTENASLRKTNSVLERALNRLTSRTALHQDKLRELTMMQASLERQKEEFDVVVSKIRPGADFGALTEGGQEDICLDENYNAVENEEEKRQDGPN